jgi:ribose transport system substrate-binding protein
MTRARRDDANPLVFSLVWWSRVELDGRMMKIRFGALLLGLGICLSGCGDKEEDGDKSYALVTTGAVGFWEICKKGGEDAGAELGVQVETLMPDGSTEQRKALEDLISKGVDGISVAAIDPENQADIFDEVADNTLLITMDTDAPTSKRQVYIGMDNYNAGWMCGELVKEALPEGGEVILFIGRLEQENAKRRRQGVIDCLMEREKDSSRYDLPGEVVKGEKYTVLATRTDEINMAKAKENVEDELTKNPDVDAMVGLFAYNPPIILDVLRERGDLGKVKIIGFDEDEETLQGIVDGQIHGTVVQDPYEYGNRSIKVLHALATGDDSVIPESKFIDIPARQIRKDNVEAFWTDLNKKLGK